MSREISEGDRQEALGRANIHSPFLRDAIRARSEIVDAFLDRGAAAAAELALASEGRDLESTLRGKRQGVALAAALGDLSGELSLEAVTALLSGFADSAIDEAVRLAHVGARSRRRAGRLRGHRHGQARQQRAQLQLGRRSPAAVRSGNNAQAQPRRRWRGRGSGGPADHRNPAEAHRGWVRAASRSPAAAFARSHSDRAAGERGHFALRIERAAVGASGLHPGPSCRR